MSLRVLPKPKKVTPRAGMLDISGDVPLFLSPLAGEEDLAAAQSFVGEARARCWAALPIEKPRRPVTSGRHVRFLVFGRDEPVAPELRVLPHPKELGGEGYVLDVDARRALAAANTPRGLFLAAQTLRQLVRIRAAGPCCRPAGSWTGPISSTAA